MKKSILNLGNVLNKTEQKTINGGKLQCRPFGECLYFGLQCAERECQILEF